LRRGWSASAKTTPRGHAAQQLLNRQQTLGMDQLEQTEFQMETLLLAVVQVVEGSQNDLKIASQLFLSE
jgi:hypothetical protein